jgi:predicted XRE-type DNA-binding protein
VCELAKGASVAAIHHCALPVQRPVPEVLRRRPTTGSPINAAELHACDAAGSSETGGLAGRGHCGVFVRLSGALGYTPEEAEHLRIRADLMLALGEVIAERGRTRAEAARALGITQPSVSDLLRGKIDRFSTDMLVQLLSHAGVDVTFKVRRRRSAAWR